MLKCALIPAVARWVTDPVPSQLPSVPAPVPTWAHQPPPLPAAGPLGAATMPPPPAPGSAGIAVAPRKKRRTGLIVVAVIVLVLACVAVFLAIGLWYNSAMTDAAQANVPADAPIGTCYGSDGSKQAISCDGPHVFEVYTSSFYLPTADYPSRFDRSLGNPICEDDLELLIGQNYLLSEWDYAMVFPDEASWNNGQRRVPCVGFFGSALQVTGPIGG